MMGLRCLKVLNMSIKKLTNTELVKEFEKANNEIKLLKDKKEDLLGKKIVDAIIIDIIKELAKRNIPIVDLGANEVMIQYYNDIQKELKAKKKKTIILSLLFIITCIAIYLQSINIL